MTRALNSSPLDSLDLDTDPIFSVVIAYEDFNCGKRAKITYDFLVEQLGKECRFTNQMWKFDVLSIPKLREWAVRDAAQADIILISCSGNDLPPEVKAWIELWLAEPTHPLALVALCDKAQPENSYSQSVRHYLTDVARRGQMEFFAQPDEWPGHRITDETILFQRDTAFDQKALPAFSGVIQRDLSAPHWGINE